MRLGLSTALNPLDPRVRVRPPLLRHFRSRSQTLSGGPQRGFNDLAVKR